jgi:hypothetical protein
MQQNKPRAILKVSRKQYCTARPWEKAGMSREKFEEVLGILPEGIIDEIHLQADAERLIAAAFGGGGGEGDG